MYGIFLRYDVDWFKGWEKQANHISAFLVLFIEGIPKLPFSIGENANNIIRNVFGILPLSHYVSVTNLCVTSS